MQQLQCKSNNSTDKSSNLLNEIIAQLNVFDIYGWMNIIKRMVLHGSMPLTHLRVEMVLLAGLCLKQSPGYICANCKCFYK